MAHVERTLTTDTDIHVVWDYMTDFTNTEEWDPPTRSTERTSGDGGVGTVYHNVSSFLGTETEVDYVVSTVVPLERFELRGDAGKSMGLHDTITFERLPEGGTRLTYRAEFHPHGAAKLAEPLLPPGLKILGDKVAACMQEKLDALGTSTAVDGSGVSGGAA
jgi:uncharacterized protein YndB with AHSA1/START domain